MDDDAKERLAKVEDADFRKILEELYYVAERNERDPRFWARERAREKAKLQEELDWAHALTASALRGVFGRRPQELANTFTDEGKTLTDGACLEVAREVCKLPFEDRRRVKE